jgi:S-adenosylmethionine:tRNA ribosyltransferase-isomerase
VFRDLPQLLAPATCWSSTTPRSSRRGSWGAKATGGAVEALVERVLPTHEVWAHLRASKSPKAGQRGALRGPDGARFEAEVLGRCGPDDALFHLRLPDEPFALLERHGHVPLPPYITHADAPTTSAATRRVRAPPGAVAAPTAALHFDAAVLDALAARGVAPPGDPARRRRHLPAGAHENLAEHSMHSEWFERAAGDRRGDRAHARRRRARRGVGTTTLRALESAPRRGTRRRGRRARHRPLHHARLRFRVVDLLLTNFHLPKSTLLMLVSAFAGYEHVARCTRTRSRERYRFFSYGDAMLLERRPPA